MKKKENVLAVIALATVIVLLAGMILATVLLSEKKSDEWEYISANDNIDYVGTDFEYLDNFRSAISTYFSDLFNEFFSSYINLNAALQDYINGVVGKIVSAMSSARIPGAKLDKIAKALNDNSLGAIFSSIKSDISQLHSIEELEAYFTGKLANVGFLDSSGKFFNGIMKETALTESEIATVIYYYLKQNANESYVGVLDVVGKDFFVSLVSDTIYVLSTIQTASQSDYLLVSAAGSLKEILYQLGGIYSALALLPGGAETAEKVFGFDFDFADGYKNPEVVNGYVSAIKGKIGELAVICGRLMKIVSAEDVKTYCRYVSLEEGKEKNDAKIQCAIRLSEILCTDVSDITAVGDTSYNSVKELADAYANVASAAADLAFELIYSLVEDVERTEPTDFSPYFSDFATAAEALSAVNMGIEEIRDLSADSEEYTALLGYADDFFGIEEGLGGLCGNLITLRIADWIYPLMKEEVKNG